MTQPSNKISNFWQELKRRKVTRVITVYAAASFVILQLVEILAPSLRLPEWTMNLILVLLVVGFIIAVILSWIYDIHPEEGIVKTEPVDKVKEEEKPKSSNSWKIASYISFVVIVGLIVLNITLNRGTGKGTEIIDKSIAVLPFRNDSPNQERMYFINGTMESILDNLCKIEDIRVVSRNSVEQYRDNPKPTPVVAEEMNVGFVLEGSGHRDGNNVRLFVQLLDDRNDQHLWSKSYDANIEEIFSMQSEIAQLVAAEIEAIITPEEKQLIEKIPTFSLTAYDFYQRGREEYFEYWITGDWIDGLYRTAAERAEDLFQKALDIDSTFAQAYIDLARIYWSKHSSADFYSEGFLDSVLMLVDVALSYDDQLAEAYTLKGHYYGSKGKMKQALEAFDKAIQLNPNNWEAYRWKGRLYFVDDLVEYIDNYHKATSLNRGFELPGLLRNLANAYYQAGFPEKYQKYMRDAFELDGDSISYYWTLATTENDLGNDDKYVYFLEKIYALDTTNINQSLNLGLGYQYTGQFKESLKYLKKYFERIEALGEVKVESMHRIGFAYWKNGYKQEADYYFDKMIEYQYKVINMEHSGAIASYYDLASVYAFRGEKGKAYEYLRMFNQRERIPRWWLTLFKRDLLFDSIRDEPEFQQILQDVEAKYQAEHERVRQWLEENDML